MTLTWFVHIFLSRVLLENKINAKDKVGEKLNLVSQVRFWAGESREYYSKTKKTEKDTATGEVKWQAPTADVLKINIDGSFKADTKTGGWGFVIRDQHGQVRGSGAGKIAYALSAAHAEILACEEAAQAASEWGMTNVQIETDAQNLVHAMRSTEYDRAAEGIIYKNLRLYMQMAFSSFEFVFIPRRCNNIAHVLAALGANRQDFRCLWPESLPDDASVMLASDVAEPGG
jgi:ribonuclease HI